MSCEEAGAAGRLFESLEGCDLDPAAEVALAGLIRAVEGGKVRRKESILLNLTGGGARKLVRESRRTRVHPDVEVLDPQVRRRGAGRVPGGAARSERMKDIFEKCYGDGGYFG